MDRAALTASVSSPPMDPPGSPFLRFLLEASVHLDGARDADKALRSALRIVRESFAADEACLAVPSFGEKRATIYASQPAEAKWGKESFASFLAGRRPRLGATRLYIALERRGRPWAVLALRNGRRRFDKGDLRDAARVGTSLSRVVERIDRARIAEVRARIDRKMMEQLRPLDLFYQVLHGLRSLTRYDHSAAVLIQERGGDLLEVVAEQVSWRKGPSERIGRRLAIGEAANRVLERGEVLGFDRRRGAWSEWRGRAEALPLAALCEGNGGEVEPMSVLVAPLATRQENLGALVVAACTPGSLGKYEAELVQRFLPVAAVAIRNLGRAANLEASVLEAESRSALAALARGVSHDVNNAIGAVLPRVQQLAVEARAGGIEPGQLITDLEDIEGSLQICRRIFGGLLSYARNAAEAGSVGSLERAIEGVRAVLQEGLERSGIELVLGLPANLPAVRCSQSDLDQLVLNLAHNAREAMPSGGRLEISVRWKGPSARIAISDSGVGIRAADLPRVKEAFFTTKKHGNGLGLSICRAILWRMRGEMEMESAPGRGTRIELCLPLASDEGRDAAREAGA